MLKELFVFLLIILPILVVSFYLMPPVLAQETSTDYIVVFKDGADTDQVTNDISKVHSVTVDQKFNRVLKGFATSIPKSKLEKIKHDPRVKLVVEDKSVEALVKNVHNIGTKSPSQSTPSGVLRIGDSASMPNTGQAVAVAVLDTGIDLTHPDLAGNIITASSCIKRSNGNDDNGHGSHVAGTIAAINNKVGVLGVASGAKLIAVKVLDSRGQGTWSSIICGLDYVASNAAKYNIKVANMSLGGSGTSDNNCGQTNADVLHQAVCRTRDAGVTIVVAAGNNGVDASSLVPAAYDDAVITVSALADSDGKKGGLGSATSYGPDDTFANFSNYGTTVDLAAPGVAIYSTYKNGGYASLSGTSMAAPHVSGAAALYIKTHPGVSWTQVRDGLKSIGETVGNGHTDPSGKHSEPVVLVNSL